MAKATSKEHTRKPVQIVLSLVIAVLIGFIGWYVWHANKKADNTLKTTSQTSTTLPNIETTTPSVQLTQTYTDPAGFTLKYPADWRFIPKGTVSGDSEYAGSEFVAQKEYDANNNAFILQLTTDTTTGTAKQYATERYVSKQSTVVSSTSSTINGYTVQTVEHKSPTGNPGIFDVFVVHNGKVVELQYFTSDVEKAYIPTYRAIVKSIKFSE